MKAVVIYNDFDREYYEEIVSLSKSLISSASTLHQSVLHDWQHSEVGKNESIQEEINEFLGRFLSRTEEDYAIKEISISEIRKAQGYLVFISNEYNRRLKEKTPIDIVFR
jgi:hypothetical protein